MEAASRLLSIRSCARPPWGMIPLPRFSMEERKRIPFRKRIASADQHLAVWLHRFCGARLNGAVLKKYYTGKKNDQ